VIHKTELAEPRTYIVSELCRCKVLLIFHYHRIRDVYCYQ